MGYNLVVFKKFSLFVLILSCLVFAPGVHAKASENALSASTQSLVYTPETSRAQTVYVRGGRGTFGSGRSSYRGSYSRGSRGFGGGGFGFGGFVPFLFFGGGGIFLILLLLFLLPVFLGATRSGGYAATSTRPRQKDSLRFNKRRILSRAKQRESQVRGKLLVAAEDDPDFDYDNVLSQSTKLVQDVQDAWNRADRSALKRLLGEGLYGEWDLRLRDFERRGWRDHVTWNREPKALIVDFQNHAHDSMDRVVILAEMDLNEKVVDSDGYLLEEDVDSPFYSSGPAYEFWTLGKDRGSWRLLSIEQLYEGAYHLENDLVVSPQESPLLSEEARTELAREDAVLDSGQVKEVYSPNVDDDVQAGLMDLALVDDRFAPDVVKISAQQTLRAWLDGVENNRGALSRLGSEYSVEKLLYGNDSSHSTRTVIRGADLLDFRIVGLDAEADPPEVSLNFVYSGVWYREDRNTLELLEGDRRREQKRVARWTLRLQDKGSDPIWQLVDSQDSPLV